MFLSGDSHANWVSDLAWLDEKPYDPLTDAGARGVELAGSAVAAPAFPYGYNSTYYETNAQAATLVRDSRELQWAEGYFRGYYELRLTCDSATAMFFGTPTIAFENSLEISLANFTIVAGQNHLQRPVAGAIANNGYLRTGALRGTNATLDIATGHWNATSFDQMYTETFAFDGPPPV